MTRPNIERLRAHHRHSFDALIGYIDGLDGDAPDPKGDDVYEAGWLQGTADRERGVKAPKYFGSHEPLDMPIKKGMTVTIPKGTPIQSNGKTVVSKRTYQVVVHHVLHGTNSWGAKLKPDEIRPPSVVWPGGSYWKEVDINLIPEAQ